MLILALFLFLDLYEPLCMRSHYHIRCPYKPTHQQLQIFFDDFLYFCERDLKILYAEIIRS